ncbi:hypothetical protein SNE40_017955 [Patella caerulea]|uniref:Uncharacterized protein n=2 Tax=Patella caerulea TaxID=87958 RepID=A0AAN8PN93_PATCE
MSQNFSTTFSVHSTESTQIMNTILSLVLCLALASVALGGGLGMMGGMYSPYMMGGMYSPYMMGGLGMMGGYSPYMMGGLGMYGGGLGMMAGMYNPYMMMGGLGGLGMMTGY